MLQKLDRITTHRKAGHDALNLAGGMAFRTSPQAALYKQVATSLWAGDGYYERGDVWLSRFQQNVAQAVEAEPQFALQLAAYGRDKRGLSLRASPVALYAEAATQAALKGTGLIRKYAPRVMYRADDPLRAIEYLKANHGSIPHGVLRGIGDAMTKFDAYQLGKYKTTGRLHDILNLTHPNPHTDEHAALWGAVIEGILPIPYTWETELSKAHAVEEKRAVWNELIRSGKLGIFALMRNIRNIIQCGADIEEALEQITRERVAASGILPFQWYKGYKAVQNAAPEIAQVFMQAIDWSLAGIEPLPGVTLVAVDNSGSMDTEQTRGMTNKEIGNLMGAMALEISSEGAVAGTFGTEFALAATSPEADILHNTMALHDCGRLTGHSTNAWKVLRQMNVEGVWVDRLVILTDEQVYDSKTAAFNKLIGTRIGVYGGRSLAGELETYLQTVNPGIIVYVVDLHSNDNTSQFSPDHPVVMLAGWSDSIFRFMSAMEAGEDVLDRIRQAY